MKEFIIIIRPLTSIWTGNIYKKNTILRETGIIGSLRWWYENLIRSVEGTACDPSETRCDAKNHCDVCELFGCMGWGRKFRLTIEETEKIKQSNLSDVILKFTILREINEIELSLLNKTMLIIEKYGSLGAKIAENNGLVTIKRNDLSIFNANSNIIKYYLKKKGNYVSNPDIRKFIFIPQDVNYPIIKELKNKFPSLKGNRNKGKRYFYKTYKRKPFRFFVYAENNGELNKIKNFLQVKNVTFTEGEKVIEEFI